METTIRFQITSLVRPDCQSDAESSDQWDMVQTRIDPICSTRYLKQGFAKELPVPGRESAHQRLRQAHQSLELVLHSPTNKRLMQPLSNDDQHPFPTAQGPKNAPIMQTKQFIKNKLWVVTKSTGRPTLPVKAYSRYWEMYQQQVNESYRAKDPAAGAQRTHATGSDGLKMAFVAVGWMLLAWRGCRAIGKRVCTPQTCSCATKGANGTQSTARLANLIPLRLKFSPKMCQDVSYC